MEIPENKDRFSVVQNKQWGDGKTWEVRDGVTEKLMSRHFYAADAIIAKNVYQKEREI